MHRNGLVKTTYLAQRGLNHGQEDRRLVRTLAETELLKSATNLLALGSAEDNARAFPARPVGVGDLRAEVPEGHAWR